MTMRLKLKALLADRRQKEVARRVGIHEVTIGTYVNHGIIPRADVAARLAAALGVDVGWLLDDGQGWPPVPHKNPMAPPAPGAVEAA